MCFLNPNLYTGTRATKVQGRSRSIYVVCLIFVWYCEGANYCCSLVILSAYPGSQVVRGLAQTPVSSKSDCTRFGCENSCEMFVGGCLG